MDFSKLQGELLRALRADKTQQGVSEDLGFGFNQVYKWESGRTHMSWVDFVRYCEICEVKLKSHLRTSFSYSGSIKNTSQLTRHFIGTRDRNQISLALGVSKSTISRWLSGTLKPNLSQVLKLMHYGSVDFYRFAEMLAALKSVPILKEQIEFEKAYLALYGKYPWLSALFSALDLAEYPRRPSVSFLADKTRLPSETIKEAIAELNELGLIHWNGNFWETRLKQVAMRGSTQDLQKTGRYVLQSAQEGVSTMESPTHRYSWKIFSFNQKHLDRLFQKYTEFFNELGAEIDAAQDGADKVYIFQATFVDVESLPKNGVKDSAD